MKAVFYGVFDKRGLVRTNKTEPSLEPGQRAVRLQVQIPDAAFAPESILGALLDVPEGAVERPDVGVLIAALEPTGSGA